jgi:Mn2+/Fe2+ NRAMP family transporter
MSNAPDDSGAIAPAPVPSALVSRNPLEWLKVFGPGAIIASLTIGTGELIFSSRGGVIFGYAVLFPFLLICLLKWGLAYSAARHMVISGAHPFERWMELPVGPHGWLTVLFFLLATVSIPVWVSFHASVLGDLLAGLTGTKHYLQGATIQLWACGLLIAVFLLALAGGYSALERIQIVIVTIMLAAVIITLVLFQPDWLELLMGFIVPQRLEFPAWLAGDSNPDVRKVAAQPIWIELSLYVGAIGGAGYDYLAYTSYIRDKHWGNAGVEGEAKLDDQTLRQWLRAPLIDCTLSFALVLVFAAVFVASGKLVLGPEHQVPGDDAFLEHQAQFVTHIHPWLFPLYVVAVFLAMGGTLYGTLEVAPTILRETVFAVGNNRFTRSDPRRIRNAAICWCTAIALAVLIYSFLHQLQLRVGQDEPLRPTDLLKPVNLFTGVFACGLICLLNPWMDRRLPAPLRMPLLLVALNVIGGIAFILVALRGYWAYAEWRAMGMLLGTLAFGIVVTWLVNSRRHPS